ncbi:helicase-associated domain-containing protein [Clostridium sp. 'deep sea']|uniref:helicase-associated domain-containing protein n=1 Tax=Clostridium sp. 'deep sea' TaxID=2779445 RepID=UPI0018968828|nr:helicase-associated domain-containing protein [Clostridium sp. 'deep sea']QOR33702.1 helicase-associated domain-containing protein [Clostridium sp. 'deep sea']
MIKEGSKMKLTEALQDAGITHWRRMAKYYQLEHLEFAGNRLYQGLYNCLRDPQKVNKIIINLPQLESSLLKAIALTQNIEYYFDYRHWRSYLNYYFDFKLEILVNLQSRGLIYINRKHQYYIPSEIQDILIKIVKDNNLSLTNEGEHYLFTGGEILLKDILRFLDSLNKTKIRITNNNSFYKTDLHKLNNQLQVNETKNEFNIGSKVDFIYKYVINSELAIVNKGEVKLTEKGLNWHEQNPVSAWQHILKYWILKYPVNASTRVANAVLLALLNTVPNYTLTLEQLRNIYQENGGINPVNSKENEWLVKAINELSYLGILYTDINTNLIKVNHQFLKNLNSNNLNWFAETSFITQPNLEILISLHADFKVHWQLACFCEDSGGKEMYHYKITKDSVYNALLRGHKLKNIMQFLKKYSVTEIPHNLIQVLKDWGNKFGKVYILDTLLICCKDKNIAKQLMYTPELATYIHGLINENTIVINRKDHDKLINKLEKLGYMPYQQIFTSDSIPFSTMIEEE